MGVEDQLLTMTYHPYKGSVTEGLGSSSSCEREGRIAGLPTEISIEGGDL